jgi:hypothetical protein
MGFISKLQLKVNKPTPAGPVTPVMPMAVPTTPARAVFDASRFKMKLKQAKIRGEVQKGKATNVKLRTRETVVEELRKNRNATAHIRMEQLLRDTSTADAYDLFEVYVELLVTRHSVIASSPDFTLLGSDVREAIASLSFASTRMDNPELREVVDMLRGFYGPQTIDPLSRCEGPDAGLVNTLMAQKLDGATPDDYDILEGLTNLAREEGIPWMAPAEPEFLKSSISNFAAPSPYPVPFMPHNIPAASAPFVPVGGVPTFQPGDHGGGMPFPPPGGAPPGGYCPVDMSALDDVHSDGFGGPPGVPAGYPPGGPAGYPPGGPAGYPPGAPAGYPPGGPAGYPPGGPPPGYYPGGGDGHAPL